MTWFIEFSNPDAGEMQRLELSTNQALTIGRGSTSQTKIPDPGLSRVHCQVELVGGAPLLSDLGSSAGTIVSGRRIDTPTELRSGQSFVAGATTFVVISDSPLDAPTAAVGARKSANPLDALIAKFDSNPQLDHFQLKKLVDRHGRSLVYRGEDDAGQNVCIKVTTAGTQEDETRFMRAMRMLQEVRDPYLVKLLRAGRKRGYCWIAMEWFAEGSIADRRDRQGIAGCLDWRDAWRIASCMAQSLHVLEQNGMVHRNIRPTSILRRASDDTWVLSDLVAAKMESAVDAAVTQHVFLPTNVAYTAPERLLGRESNAHSLQADIYSLGAVLTEALTGEPPFGYGDLADLLPRIRGQRRQVDRDSQIGLNERFADFVNQLTEPEPHKRTTSASALWRDVERVGKLSGMSSI